MWRSKSCRLVDLVLVKFPESSRPSIRVEDQTNSTIAKITPHTERTFPIYGFLQTSRPSDQIIQRMSVSPSHVAWRDLMRTPTPTRIAGLSNSIVGGTEMRKLYWAYHSYYHFVRSTQISADCEVSREIGCVRFPGTPRKKIM